MFPEVALLSKIRERIAFSGHQKLLPMFREEALIFNLAKNVAFKGHRNHLSTDQIVRLPPMSREGAIEFRLAKEAIGTQDFLVQNQDSDMQRYFG